MLTVYFVIRNLTHPVMESASLLSWHKCCVVTAFACGYSIHVEPVTLTVGESLKIALLWLFHGLLVVISKCCWKNWYVISASIKTNSLSYGNSHCQNTLWHSPKVSSDAVRVPLLWTMVICVTWGHFFVLHKALLKLESAVASNYQSNVWYALCLACKTLSYKCNDCSSVQTVKMTKELGESEKAKQFCKATIHKSLCITFILLWVRSILGHDTKCLKLSEISVL